jgi:hypothetical protein
LAHVADLNGFVEGIRILLKGEGLAVIEVPYVKDMIYRCEFDTIYHEHLCYFSLTALESLFRRHGLIIQDVQCVSIHGGSIRLFVGHQTQNISSDVDVLLKEESEWGVHRIDFYQEFSHRVEGLKVSLTTLLQELKIKGNRLAAYGAAAKGATLLNYFGIGEEILDFVVDRSPYKQGHYMPGVHLAIHSPAKLLEAMPDYVLLLAWNFVKEIKAQQTRYTQQGGHFIIPVPEVRIT